jgi:hypothetical protein
MVDEHDTNSIRILCSGLLVGYQYNSRLLGLHGVIGNLVSGTAPTDVALCQGRHKPLPR